MSEIEKSHKAIEEGEFSKGSLAGRLVLLESEIGTCRNSESIASLLAIQGDCISF